MENQTVTIHVRFEADGSVRDIGERPEGASAQDWFNRLSRYEGNGYQPLSGGRAVFRVTRVEINALSQGVL
jgi:hypothetical protein